MASAMSPGARPQGAGGALNMSGLNRILSQDMVSGLIEVEAGISGAELERQLDAQGMTLGQTFDSSFGDTSLGGWIAFWPTRCRPRLRGCASGDAARHVDGPSGFRSICWRRHGHGWASSPRPPCWCAPCPVEPEECHAVICFAILPAAWRCRRCARSGAGGYRAGPALLADDGETRFERARMRRTPERQRLEDISASGCTRPG